jgi:hypothetical protein
VLELESLRVSLAEVLNFISLWYSACITHSLRWITQFLSEVSHTFANCTWGVNRIVDWRGAMYWKRVDVQGRLGRRSGDAAAPPTDSGSAATGSMTYYATTYFRDISHLIRDSGRPNQQLSFFLDEHYISVATDKSSSTKKLYRWPSNAYFTQ